MLVERAVPLSGGVAQVSIFQSATYFDGATEVNQLVSWRDSGLSKFHIENNTEIVCDVPGKYRPTLIYGKKDYNSANLYVEKNGEVIESIYLHGNTGVITEVHDCADVDLVKGDKLTFRYTRQKDRNQQICGISISIIRVG